MMCDNISNQGGKNHCMASQVHAPRYSFFQEAILAATAYHYFVVFAEWNCLDCHTDKILRNKRNILTT
jgi:hypothetical protein